MDIKIDWKSSFVSQRPRACRRPLWAPGGHAQTILGHLLPAPELTLEREDLIIPLEDGDRLAADYLPGARDQAVLYLFHGLGGNSRRGYMNRMTRQAAQRGFHVIAVNHRGCGNGRGLAANPYHSGRAEDISAVIAYGRQRFPHMQHLAVGYSLSGNALLLLQAGFRGTVQPDFGIAVNAPIDLGSAALWIKKGFNRLYDIRFVRDCERSVKQRMEDGLISEEYRFPLVNTLFGFDKIYTAPAGGFRDRWDYYETCSAGPHLSRIKIPTVIITSRDDPMVKVGHYLGVDYSDQVIFHLEKHGGHMGYLTAERTPAGDNRWMEYALDFYLTRWMGISDDYGSSNDSRRAD